MSEKRFTIDNTNRIYERGDIMSKTTVVTMLNSLSEENEQLKKRNKFLEDFDSRFKEQVEAIIKKNEQLKEENEQLRQSLDHMITKATEINIGISYCTKS